MDRGSIMELLFMEQMQFGVWVDESPFVPSTAPVGSTESLTRGEITSLGVLNTGSFKQTHIHMEGCEGLSD